MRVFGCFGYFGASWGFLELPGASWSFLELPGASGGQTLFWHTWASKTYDFGLLCLLRTPPHTRYPAPIVCGGVYAGDKLGRKFKSYVRVPTSAKIGFGASWGFLRLPEASWGFLGLRVLVCWCLVLSQPCPGAARALEIAARDSCSKALLSVTLCFVPDCSVLNAPCMYCLLYTSPSPRD